MNSILDYFDLNKRIARITSGLKYKNAVNAANTKKPIRLSAQMPLYEQLFLYLGTVIGVLFSAALTQFRAGRIDNLNISVTTIAVSCVVTLFIIPPTFEKLNVNPDAPFLVRFGLFVQNGVFWEVIFDSVGKFMNT